MKPSASDLTSGIDESFDVTEIIVWLIDIIYADDDIGEFAALLVAFTLHDRRNLVCDFPGSVQSFGIAQIRGGIDGDDDISGKRAAHHVGGNVICHAAVNEEKGIPRNGRKEQTALNGTRRLSKFSGATYVPSRV